MEGVVAIHKIQTYRRLQRSKQDVNMLRDVLAHNIYIEPCGL